MLEKNRIREISFLLMVLITNICFVIPSCSKPHILIHNFKSISKSDINTLHDSKYILRIVTNNDEKKADVLLPILKKYLPENVASRVVICKEEPYLGALLLAGAPVFQEVQDA